MTPETADAATALMRQVRVAQDIVSQLMALVSSGSPLVSIGLRTADGQTYSASFEATVDETKAIGGGMLQLAQARLDALNALLAAL